MVALDVSHASRRRASDAAVPQSVKGRFRRLKTRIAVAGAAVFFLLPWVPWNRGEGRPGGAVMFDLAAGRFHLFGLELRTQELYFLTGFLLFAALGLILANAIAGRVWCGFACPHTVWSDAFLAIERLVEGDRRERIRKRDAPLSARRIAELATKHALWIALSCAVGIGTVLYFGEAGPLLRDLLAGRGDAIGYGFAGSVAVTVYALGGFFRETMCKFMCPWPRLQGAIWDPEALSVTYRDVRGEPRTSPKKAPALRAAGKPAGDCVDCDLCVAVCPMGIDIRQGPSIACINCGLCVDACDGVMGKLSRPRGLIDFVAWTEIEALRRGERPVVPRIVRPKTAALAAALFGLVFAAGLTLELRVETAMSVQHDRNPLSVRLSDGRVRNGYTLRVSNKTDQERRLKLEVLAAAPVEVAVIGGDAGEGEIVLPPDADREVRVTVAARPEAAGPLTFVGVDPATGQDVRISDTFIR